MPQAPPLLWSVCSLRGGIRCLGCSRGRWCGSGWRGLLECSISLIFDLRETLFNNCVITTEDWDSTDNTDLISMYIWIGSDISPTRLPLSSHLHPSSSLPLVSFRLLLLLDFCYSTSFLSGIYRLLDYCNSRLYLLLLILFHSFLASFILPFL